VNSAYTNCDAVIAKLQRPVRETSHPNWLLTTTILASGLSLVDVSVVNVGLPALGTAFSARATDLQWIINAYLLPLSALLLLGGAVGDRYGHGRLLVLGLAIFAFASIGCGCASTLNELLVFRGLQGVGAAVIMPNSLATLGEHFSEEARGRAIGTWAASGAVIAAVSPVLGGWLIDTFGWRWVFLINLPPAALTILLACVFIGNVPREVKSPPLDLLGGALGAIALGAMTWGLTEGSGSSGWTSAAILVELVGLGFLAGFLAVEQSKQEAAMMPLSLFGSSNFVGVTLLTLLLYGALSAVLVLAPYVLIQAGGYSGTQGGAALLPFAVVLAIASPFAGTLAGKAGPRLPLIVGPLLVAGGFGLILRFSHGEYWSTMFPAIVVIAVGVAGAAAPLTIAVFASVDARHSGSASGLNSAVARVGGLVATALLGRVLGTTGPALVIGFHATSVICALASGLASLSAFSLITVGGPSKPAAPRGTHRPSVSVP
jgi:EmrB/QacA subfamily drug resistance transporter